MKYYIILLLAVVMASCGSTRKAVHSFRSEVKKTEFFAKDSSGNSQIESSVKKVDSSHVIEKEDSGYERETIEVITETPYMPSGKEYFDTASFRPVHGGNIPITRTINRITREKGQKKIETTQQVAVKEEQQQKQAQAAVTSEKKVIDTTAAVEIKSKEVERKMWWQWLLLLIPVYLIIRYRKYIIGGWKWLLYRGFGHKS